MLYEVETRVLKQALKRNKERFPSDFMFELNYDEIEFMVSQSMIPSKQHLGASLKDLVKNGCFFKNGYKKF